MAGYNRGDDELDDLQDFALDGEDEEAEGTNILMVVVVSLLFLVAFGCVVWVAYNNGVAHGRDEALNQTAKSVPYELPAGQTDGQADKNAQAGTVARLVAQSMQKHSEQMHAGQSPAETTPAPVKPAAKPEAKPASKAVAKPQPEVKKPAPQKIQQRAAAKPEARPAPKAEVKPAVKPAAAGAYTLQIGAFPSEAEAEIAWKKFSQKHSALLSGASHNIQKAVLTKGTWYRLRVGSFASKEDAAALCGKIKAHGGACFPAR